MYAKHMTHSRYFSINVICFSLLIFFFFNEIYCFQSEGGYCFSWNLLEHRGCLRQYFHLCKFAQWDSLLRSSKLKELIFFDVASSFAAWASWHRDGCFSWLLLQACRKLVPRRSPFAHRVLGLALFQCSNHSTIHVFFNCFEFNKISIEYGII